MAESRKTENVSNVSNTVAKTVTKNTTAVDHSKDVLISNDTTFAELIRILMQNPETTRAAQVEAAEREKEEREKRLRDLLGDDYELVYGKSEVQQKKCVQPGGTQPESAHDPLKKSSRRPGAVQLRNNYRRIATIDLDGGSIEVFTCGYGIVDNGDRKTVVWVPDCGSVTYCFTPLKDSERQYMSQTSEIGEDQMGRLPWYYAILIAGENQIAANLDHPKAARSNSDFDQDNVKPAYWWVGGAHIDTPEEAYLKKEAAEERKKALTEKQKAVYEMYFELGMTEVEIARECQISRRAVRDRLDAIKTKIRKI
jgi:hypothetical protein